MQSGVSEMLVWQIALVVAACGIGSLLIGAVGIGGVIVMPALIISGIDPAVGIVTVFMGFAPTALIKVFLMSRTEGMIPLRAGLSSAISAAIGSALGGLLVMEAPRQVLTCLVGAFALIAGFKDLSEYVLARRRAHSEAKGSLDIGTDPARQGDGGDEAMAAHQRDCGGISCNRDDARRDRVENGGGEEMTGLAGSDSGGLDLVAVAVRGMDGAEATLAGIMPPSDQTLPVQAQDGDCAQDSTVGRQSARAKVMSICASNGAIPLEERWSATTLELCILFIIGLFTGLGSVLTGTGGPLIYLPIVLTWKAKSVNPKTIIGASAMLSTFLVIAAVISLLVNAQLAPDWGLCIIIMVSSLIGVTVGVRILQIASRDKLQLAMAVLLVGVGVLTLVQGATPPAAADESGRRRLPRLLLPTPVF